MEDAPPRDHTTARRWVGSWLPALLVLNVAVCGCRHGDSPTAPLLRDADHRVLFVGNSLTYTNDLPGAVATVADALGRDVAVASVAYPNFALEDHWHYGIADVITELAPDIVVMQQGPSSLPDNQLNLAAWSDSLSAAARRAGGEPALLMVWPSLSREFAFDDVRDAYHTAAEGVTGAFIPAGEAFRALHAQHPELSPFGPDGFHPSDVGTVLAAYVAVGTLFGDAVTALPAELEPGPNGGRAISLDAEAAPILRAIADSVVAAWR
jgi:hypothetical protein